LWSNPSQGKFVGGKRVGAARVHGEDQALKWKWDVRPEEFKALPAADRRRIFHRCYRRALRRPVVFLPLIIGTAGMMFAAQFLLWKAVSQPGFLLKWLVSMLAIGMVSVVFARYVTIVLREELRLISIGCCLKCWYDLTGNESGICPECGTPRHVASASAQIET
jgi:hypothetical protein